MKHILMILLPGMVLYLGACRNDQTPRQADATAEVTPHSYQPGDTGFYFLRTTCMNCHHLDPASTNPLAPAFGEIRAGYLAAGLDRPDFINAVYQYVNEPDAKKSLVKDAVSKYGVMPRLSVDSTQAAAIAAFIYDQPLDDPDWYPVNYAKLEQRSARLGAELGPLMQSKSLALQTKTILGKNLMAALQKGGAEHALAFCSERALHLTDSMSQVLQADIRRVSDRNRNPQNKANKEETAYIHRMAAQIAAGKKPTVEINREGDRSLAYIPIVTDKMCLQCHGKEGSEVLPATLSKIRAIYPADQATGYSINEIRGAFVVKLPNEQ